MALFQFRGNGQGRVTPRLGVPTPAGSHHTQKSLIAGLQHDIKPGLIVGRWYRGCCDWRCACSATLQLRPAAADTTRRATTPSALDPSTDRSEWRHRGRTNMRSRLPPVSAPRRTPPLYTTPCGLVASFQTHLHPSLILTLVPVGPCIIRDLRPWGP